MSSTNLYTRSGVNTPPPDVKWYRARLCELWEQGMLTRREALVLIGFTLGFEAKDMWGLFRIREKEVSDLLSRAKHRIRSGLTVREEMDKAGWHPYRYTVSHE